MNIATAQATGAGLERYLQDIRRFPLLDAEEERRLIRRYRRRRDMSALDRLAGSHLRLVFKIARGYLGYGLPLEDLISEGNVGLVKAIERFEEGRGARLATYAGWWIRAEINEYILRSASLVKMGTTAAQKKLFFNLRRLKSQMRVLGEGDLDPGDVTRIAERLGVPESEVVLMNRRLAGPDRSLNAPLREDGDGDGEWLDMLADDSADADQEMRVVAKDELSRRRHLMRRGLATLKPRERHILTERRLKDDHATLEELGRQYGISRERVRQIEVRAFEKLSKEMKRTALAAEARRGAVHQ
ncbi:MAG: RNA polymerase factor sigma-32 [Alphaproteobacteria bacterium]